MAERNTGQTWRLGTLIAGSVLAMSTLGASLGSAQEGDDSFWPREITSDRGRIVVYEPQVEDYTNDRVQARAAVSVTIQGQSTPIFGAMWFDCRLATDLENRVAYLEALTVSAAKFPTMEQSQIDQLSRFVEEEAPKWDLTISLDELLANLDAAGYSVNEERGLNNDPPEIIFTTQPSVLVTIDGEPQLQDIEGADAQYVVNTAFFIAKNNKDNTYYLRGGEEWFKSRDLTGSWEVAGQLPAEMRSIAQQIEEEEREQKKKLADQAAATGADDAAGAPGGDGSGQTPQIIVRTKPAELIQTNGEPDYATIEGTQLLYLKNSESDVVMDTASQQYYVLLAGRWYRSAAMTGGNWQYVANDELPADFTAIPADSDLGDVRTSVTGTQEAREAMLENTVPQTAEVDRKTATCEVKYDGSPEFQSCGEGVSYAKNCDKDVLLIDGTYYCCDNAVWFVANRPDGGWQVATELPAVIQDLPPDCPVYNVKYVYIYESTPDVVYVGYTPGYTGSYVYRGCVVYGTGYWYRPWYRHYYYPRPVTWGFGVHYNPWTGWGFSFGISYGWLHLGVGWCRPWYGGWWGRGGYRWGYRHGYRYGYHHGYRQGYQAGVRMGYRAGQRSPNLYRTRDRGVIRTADATRRPAVAARPAERPATKPATRPAQRPTTGPPTGGATKDVPRQPSQRDFDHQARPSQKVDRENNVYTDRDGNVYRRDGDQWQGRDKSGWNRDVQPPPQSRQQLDQQRQSRDRGAQQNRTYDNLRGSQRGAAQRGGAAKGRGGGR